MTAPWQIYIYSFIENMWLTLTCVFLTLGCIVNSYSEHIACVFAYTEESLILLLFALLSIRQW